MIALTETSRAPDATKSKREPANGRFAVEIGDVTGLRRLSFGVSPSTPAHSVARAAAARMSLPQDTPWLLRDEQTGAYLDDQKPIGDQVARTGSRLTVTPRAHLGAG
jgi:hypothetical protein